MMPINQYGSSDSGLGGAWGGALDFLNLGVNSWAKIEQINALKDSNPRTQNQLAEVDQQVQPVVHQPVNVAGAQTEAFNKMLGQFGKAALLIGGLILVVRLTGAR